MNPYYLRPFGANERFTSISGARWLSTGGITGDYDYEHLGITSVSGSVGRVWRMKRTRVLDPADLDPGHVIEYRTGAGAGFNFVQAGGAILLHYKVSGSVPEPKNPPVCSSPGLRLSAPCAAGNNASSQSVLSIHPQINGESMNTPKWDLRFPLMVLPLLVPVHFPAAIIDTTPGVTALNFDDPANEYNGNER